MRKTATYAFLLIRWFWSGEIEAYVYTRIPSKMAGKLILYRGAWGCSCNTWVTDWSIVRLDIVCWEWRRRGSREVVVGVGSLLTPCCWEDSNSSWEIYTSWYMVLDTWKSAHIALWTCQTLQLLLLKVLSFRTFQMYRVKIIFLRLSSEVWSVIIEAIMVWAPSSSWGRLETWIGGLEVNQTTLGKLD
jgi:hypothetical protein